MSAPRKTMAVPAPYRGLQFHIDIREDELIAVMLTPKNSSSIFLAYTYGAKEECRIEGSRFDDNYSMWVRGTCFEIRAVDAKDIAEYIGCRFTPAPAKEGGAA